MTRIQEAFDVVQGIFEAIETTFLEVYHCYGVTVGISTAIEPVTGAVAAILGWAREKTEDLGKQFAYGVGEQGVSILGYLTNVFDIASMVFACPCWTGIDWDSANSTTMDFAAWLSLAIPSVVCSALALVSIGRSIGILAGGLREGTHFAERSGSKTTMGTISKATTAPHWSAMVPTRCTYSSSVQMM